MLEELELSDPLGDGGKWECCGERGSFFTTDPGTEEETFAFQLINVGEKSNRVPSLLFRIPFRYPWSSTDIVSAIRAPVDARSKMLAGTCCICSGVDEEEEEDAGEGASTSMNFGGSSVVAAAAAAAAAASMSDESCCMRNSLSARTSEGSDTGRYTRE